MKLKYLFIGLSIMLAWTACNTQNTKHLKSGKWIAHLSLNNSTDLPFNVEVAKKGDLYQFIISNAEEQISISDISMVNDSVNFEMPVFESVFKTALRNDSLIGTWTKYGNAKYAVPFVMVYGESQRFPVSEKPLADYSGKWDLSFSPTVEEDKYPAIGDFKQNGNTISGTIITETGDYRYLEGIVNGSEFQLSTFDGAHAFLFKGHFDSDELIHGEFFSGTTWNEPFIGNKDENVALRSPETLTYLKEGYDELAFTFPNINGDSISLSEFKGKPVIVQILGSWCPNCMDETKYYIQLKKQYPSLEIIGLAYERSSDFNKAIKPLSKMIDDLGVNYEMLVAGTWSKKQAGETLPMLNHIMSFPTSIFIDKSGAIRRIHTGFYGPGTGIYFENYARETELLIEKML